MQQANNKEILFLEFNGTKKKIKKIMAYYIISSMPILKLNVRATFIY